MVYVFRVFILLFIFSLSAKCYGQLITNPSFEGNPMVNVAPFPWTGCNMFSTPDTQPGIWEVVTPPSKGNSYLGLVTRGNLGPYANNNEAAQVKLISAFKTGKTYEFSIDLAYSDTQGHDVDWNFLSYANPVILKIWGGATSCEKSELLWESPVVNHLNWQTYDFSITPTLQQTDYLILEANHASLPTYFGNILIDNLIEKTITEPEPAKPVCSLESFNMFTPNGDATNEVFIFKPGSDIAKFNLKVYNRWGNMVFETNDIEKGWDGSTNGKKCSDGVYFWHAAYMCISGNSIVESSRKGVVTLVR